MKKRPEGKTARSDKGAEGTATPKVRFSLRTKIVVFLLAVLVPLAVASSYFAYQSLQTNLTAEFTNKGTAIANSLASSSVDLIVNRDASTVQALFDQFAGIKGVAYVMVYDAQQNMIAHTFVPVVPKGIIEQNPVPGTAQKGQVREIAYVDPVKGTERKIIDVGVTMLAGQLGTVRVGQGDLTHLAPVTSRDEIGQMTATFNDSIVRLRALVQTETERDDERRKREELQQNIIKFLDT